MGKDKYRSSSRSPDRRYRRDETAEEYERSEQRRRQREEEEERRRGARALEAQQERSNRGYGDAQQQQYSPGSISGGAPPQGYQGEPQYNAPPAGGYRGQPYNQGQQQQQPQSYNQGQQQYGSSAGGYYSQQPSQQYGSHSPAGGYGYPPPAAGYGPPQSGYSQPGAYGHTSPPPGTYDRAPSSPTYGQPGAQQYPPPAQPYSGQYQGGYAPPPGPPPGQGPPNTYGSPSGAPQGAYYGPPSGPPPNIYGPPSGPPPPVTYGGPPGGAPGGLGFSSRPQYSTEGINNAQYKPQSHSTAQDQGETGTAFFAGTSDPTTVAGGGTLDNFTKGLNTVLHNYARTLFPVTSTYSATTGLIAPEVRTGNRFESFAGVKNGNGAKWYVDGKDYMFALSVALEKARESIYILDWWLSPELYLRRPPKLNEQYRIDRMFQAAAARGVRINIIVYKEVTQALTLDSSHTKHALEDLHPNICVFRHPDHLPDRDNVIRDTWSKIRNGTYQLGDGIKGLYGFKDDITLYYAHHEKLCLIDGEIAFMGGLDLCFGRFDTNEHPIADVHPSDLNAIVYPGQDYNNARYQDFQHVDKFEENAVSRLDIPRIGWSDIAMSFMGPTVGDLELHFKQRWNFIYEDKYDARKVRRYSALDESTFKGGHGYHRRHLKNKVKEGLLGDPDQYYQQQEDPRNPEPEKPEPEGVRLQILRSCCKWSHGTATTEHSIANAYIGIISAAKHFVYMENQFFITATDPNQKPILNMIGRAIVDRIIRAHNDAERFRIVVIIPAVPGFAGDLQDESSLGTRAIMEFQYRAINRDRGYSIMEQIQKAGINPMEYIRFYNLRCYDRINTAGADAGKATSGVNYENAARAHDESVGGGYGLGEQQGKSKYGSAIKGDEYERYQHRVPNLASGGQWDSVAKCYMLGGGDIRQVPWDGNPDKEIDAFVSEELYVHSKLLIADDRIVLMGSANLNDRSQLGDHDSEIACIIEDPTPLPSHMNGRKYTASHFAATLRRQIFRKHLGLIPAQTLGAVDENMQPFPVPNIYDFDSPEDRLVEDPLSEVFWNFWNQTAKINTDVFARVFHAVPHDSVTNWKKYDEYWSKHFAVPKLKTGMKKLEKAEGAPKPEAPYKWGHVVSSEFSPGAQGAREVKEILSAVRGTLVEMPLDFLKEEDVAKEGLGLNAFTEALYT